MKLGFLCLCLGLGMVLGTGCKKDSQATTSSEGRSVAPVVDEKALIEKGKALTSTKGCIACHSFDGSKKQGPTLKGLYGSKVTVLTQGKERVVVADDAYIKRSIQTPTADLVKGYESILMVTVPVSDDEVVALTAFIKSLK